MNRLIAIGDSHGCYKSIYLLITEVIALQKDDRLVLLGDYIDRGPASKDVLDFLMELSRNGYDITALMGNHEDMMLKSVNSAMDNYNWMLNGGDETLHSFKVSTVNEIDDKYIAFISSMPKYLIAGNFIFVHGGFNDDIDDPFSDEYSMMWERRFQYNSPVFKDKTIVHGHRPHSLAELRDQVKTNPSVINIDTGCVYGKELGLGDLAGLDVNEMKLYSVPCSES